MVINISSKLTSTSKTISVHETHRTDRKVDERILENKKVHQEKIDKHRGHQIDISA